VIALLGGAGAALCFAVSTLGATIATRNIGGGATLAWIAVIGCLVLAAPIALLASPHELSGNTWWLLALAGLANVLGLRLEYHAFTRAPVGVVTAVASAEGMVVTVLALIAGASLAPYTLLLLVIISVGVAVTAARPGESSPQRGHLPVPLAIALPCMFGVGLYLTSKGAAHHAILWAALAPRLAGTLAITAPFLARGEIRLTAHMAPILAIAATAEACGFICYVLGARHDAAISAVATSQFTVLATVGAYLLFGESLSRRQVVGIGMTILGVSALAATSV
jgi:drug/metabolite transporter (DMT)-like permease